MADKMEHKKIVVNGMTCFGCEGILEKKLKAQTGVETVAVNYKLSTVTIEFKPQAITLDTIYQRIEEAGYCPVVNKKDGNSSYTTLIYSIMILLGIYLMIKNTIGFQFIPQINQTMGFGMLFIAGLFTSVHCIAMCGGINLSQCAVCVNYSDLGIVKKLKPSASYNLGRVISYTLLGGIVGAIGSVFTVSPVMKAAISMFAGVFMILMGINMLGIMPILRKWLPKLPKRLHGKIDSGKSGKTPFIVGLLNGFMPCGPLQAMQLYALGTGSFFMGAASMFLFSLGTVPLMFAFGAFSTLLNAQFTKQMMKVSAVLIIVLGIVMGNRGLSLAGINLESPVAGMAAGQTGNAMASSIVEDGYQTITTNLESGGYPIFEVRANIPLKWTIVADKGSLNGCNNEIVIPGYKLSKSLTLGENIIEFTPNEPGIITYSCWMGMIRSKIVVTE